MERKGNLVLFVSYAPGAGKTYRMLEYADKLSKEHLVIYGYINHQAKRAFTEKYKSAAPVVPKNCAHMKTGQIIADRPEYVVIDEPAFFNICTQRQLYKDIEELLNHGISVISCCNLRIFNRVNRRCSRISGICLRQPVPDEFLANVTELHFIDVAASKLRERYLSGELFEEKSNRLDRYFDLPVLNTYREIALEEVKNYEREYPHIAVLCEKIC